MTYNGHAKVQHYVPRFLLKNFGKGKKNLVFVYDKKINKEYKTNIKNIASETKFYDFKTILDGVEAIGSIEETLAEIEGNANTALKKILDAEDDEFVGEDVTCLYSPAEHVIAIQRNFYSVSSGKIYDYFGQIGKRLFDEDTTYIFEPMLDSSQRDFKYAVIRSLDFSCVDLNNDNLEDTIKNTGNYFGAKNMVCHLSIESHNRGALSLKKDKIVSLVKNALRHNNMSTLKAKVRKDPDSPVEEIDFLEQRIESSFRLRYSKQQPITHIRIWHEMVKKYPDVLKKIRGQS